MPELTSIHFGKISYQESAAFHFPHGLPGFERARTFLPVSLPDRDPLIFLQNVEDPALCFLALPILAADPAYRLEVSPDDLALLGMPPRPQPRIGADVLCLAVVSLREAGPTANLLAPIVINLRNRRAVQAIAPQGGYSHQHALLPVEPDEVPVPPC